MRIEGLDINIELFQCIYALIFGIVTLLTGLISILFALIGLPYSAMLIIILFIISAGSFIVFLEIKNNIEIKTEERAMKRKEEKEDEN
jgi:hypothetical protein